MMGCMSDDLVAFLAARLDEDEAAAKDERIYFGPHPETIGEFEGWLVVQEERVLREVAAKRAILAEHPQERLGGRTKHRTDWGCSLCHEDDGAQWHPGYCKTVKALAAIYSGHPGYRQEWKS
jgi:Family of unknown function (DUF6221)